jgi:hypothetical protein
MRRRNGAQRTPAPVCRRLSCRQERPPSEHRHQDARPNEPGRNGAQRERPYGGTSLRFVWGTTGAPFPTAPGFPATGLPYASMRVGGDLEHWRGLIKRMRPEWRTADSAEPQSRRAGERRVTLLERLEQSHCFRDDPQYVVEQVRDVVRVIRVVRILRGYARKYAVVGF